MTRDYYYSIDVYGSLALDGMIQTDPWFVDFFFRRLAPTANPLYPDFPFVSRCGDEMNYLKPADTPIVYTGYDGVRLYYAHSLNVLFHPSRLSYSHEGILYHAAPVGNVARLVPQVAMEIAKHIMPWGPWYAYNDTVRGRIIPILPNHLPNDVVVIRPREDNQCVACGEANPHTFFMTFLGDKSEQSVHTFIRPDARMQGSLGIVHGGFVSLLLDEVMGKCISMMGLRAPTAQLNVRFRKPLRLGVEYKVSGRVASMQGRKLHMVGEIREVGDTSSTAAEAEALFLTIPNSIATT